MDSHDTVRSWAKAALVLIAILALVLALNKLVYLPLVIREMLREDRFPENLPLVLICVFTPFLLGVITVILIRSRKGIAARICRPIGRVSATWEPAAYRLMYLFAGVLILSWAFFDLAGVGGRIQDLSCNGPISGLGPLMWDSVWVGLAQSLIKLSIGGYLLCEAPHLVKWQLRRTRSRTSHDTDLSTDALLPSDCEPVGESLSPTAVLLAWIRLGLVLLGVVAFGFATNHLDDLLWLLGDWEVRDILAYNGILFVGPLPILLAGYVLIRHCDSLARRIVDDTYGTAPLWERTAYQIAATFAAVMIIAKVFPTTVSGLLNIILRARHAPGTIDETFLSDRNPWIFWTYTLILAAFGVFLLWFAPSVVKWKEHPVVEDQRT